MNLLKKTLWRLQKTGFPQTLRWYFSHAQTLYREKTRGIDTSGKLPVDAKDDKGCNGYEPIMYECLDRLFEFLPIRESDVLIDYGSGKGRVLIEASMKPFAKIIGVEFDQQLVAQCRANFEKFNPLLLGERVVIHHGDAQEFELPPETTHIFIWNSFVGTVLENVSNRIQSFMNQSQHEVHFVLALPDGEKNSLKHFQFLGNPQNIPTHFWTGVDIYHWSSKNRQDCDDVLDSNRKSNHPMGG